jgi:DNA processing protein
MSKYEGTMDIKELKRTHSHYPVLLGHISDPPDLLYYQGNIELLNSLCIGIVGTRKVTPYGKQATTTITADLVRHGFTIVSGLAMGVDTAAHKATLDAGGKTIGVLGTGLDDQSFFPKDNLRLREAILDSGGLIVSEYPAGTHGTVFTFPRRNRIISGLSKGIVVIEADEKSGALITAKSAAEQNRDVFAVPGPITSPRSIGPNKLIQAGAKLILSAVDVVQEYEMLPLFATAASAHAAQNPTEEKILSIVREHGQPFIDTIIAESGIEPHHVISTLSMLELQGAIKSLPNGRYYLK